MNTKSWHYNNAVKENSEAREIYADDIFAAFEATPENKNIERIKNGHFALVDNATAQVKSSGAFPYSSLVAKRLAVLMNEKITSDTDHRLSVLDSVVYNTNRYNRNKETIEHYQRMEKDGYISIQDITEQDNKKKALLRGHINNDWQTIVKDDETVRLVCLNGRIGYQSLKMRTRFYSVGADQDIFIKII